MRDAKNTLYGPFRVRYISERYAMQKESLGGRFTEVPFLSQFSFPNDVPYDRNISVAISMDYGTSIRARVRG